QAHSYSGKYGIMPVNKNDSFKVKLITSNEPVATYLIDRIFSDDQKITVDHVNKTLTLEFTASNIIELQSFIYSFGAKVKVIEPANIVDVVKEQVKKLVEMYEL
ncbi:MAG: WYL domain-containing protein, partial [Succinivibrio sp.]|nr:WYL domain-containing protein [Succinivibrio sp.]